MILLFGWYEQPGYISRIMYFAAKPEKFLGQGRLIFDLTSKRERKDNDKS